MSSVYPDVLDSFSVNFTNTTVSFNDHPRLHNEERDALNRIERELGIVPSGAFLDVKSRLDDFDTRILGVESAWGGAEGAFPTLDARLDDLDARITGIDTELGTNPSGTLNSVRDRLNVVDSQIAQTNANVTDIETSVNSMNDRLDEAGIGISPSYVMILPNAIPISGYNVAGTQVYDIAKIDISNQVRIGDPLNRVRIDALSLDLLPNPGALRGKGSGGADKYMLRIFDTNTLYLGDVDTTVLISHTANITDFQIDNSGFQSEVGLRTYSDTNNSLFFSTRARGSSAAPRRTKSNDIILMVQGRGAYAPDDSSVATLDATARSSLRSVATEDHTATAHGASMAFLTTSRGASAMTERVRIGDNQVKDVALHVFPIAGNVTLWNTNDGNGDRVLAIGNANVFPSGAVGGGGVLFSQVGVLKWHDTGGNQISIGQRDTGWTALTGTASKTAFDTATATVQQVAQRLKALTDFMLSNGQLAA